MSIFLSDMLTFKPAGVRLINQVRRLNDIPFTLTPSSPAPAPAPAPSALTTEQRPVEGELLRQVLDVSDALVHGPGEVVGVVQAAQDDAGEVDGFRKVAHEGALDAHHVPPGQG